jgi:hypothetical protein
MDVLDAPVRLIYHKNGGHCGFSTGRMSNEKDAPPVPAHGWLGEELSRVLFHIKEKHRERIEKQELEERIKSHGGIVVGVEEVVVEAV